MRKEVWVDCSKENLEEIATLYGATGIYGQSKRGLKTLPKDFKVYEIRSRTDVRKLTEYINRVSYVGVCFPDWKVVPTENLIALFQDSKTKLIVKTDDPEYISLYDTVLEVGVDGVLVSTPDAIKTACLKYNPPFQVNFVDVKVTKVKKIYLGKRACVDCVMSYGDKEGLFVGAKTNGYFVAIAETKENQFVNTRDWRVNAGAAGLYTRAKTENGLITPKYLDDLVSGDEIITVDSGGVTRVETVLRVKKEYRPMIFIEAMHKGMKFSTCSQFAETVSLLTKDGPKPVTEIDIGDELKLYSTELTSTHFGRPVREKITEV